MAHSPELYLAHLVANKLVVVVVVLLLSSSQKSAAEARGRNNTLSWYRVVWTQMFSHNKHRQIQDPGDDGTTARDTMSRQVDRPSGVCVVAAPSQYLCVPGDSHMRIQVSPAVELQK